MAKALIYGLKPYTDSWARIKRAHKGFEFLPASDLRSLTSDIAKYPKLRIVAIGCWTEMIISTSNGLDLVETIPPLVQEVYDQLGSLSKAGSLKVSNHLGFDVLEVSTRF